MKVGGDGTLAGQRFAKVALIHMRSLNCVGGIRENRNFTRRKGSIRRITPMMLMAAANEIARRRAKNKAAAQSRRINRN